MCFADNENPETRPYKFNGKELDLFHGLNWYEYLARNRPAAGRFTPIDPLSEKYFALSPYVFCTNNPVNYIDPDGMDWFRTKDNSVQYDPNIKKNCKLGRWIYLFRRNLLDFRDNNGNILENYRADGSIVYKKEKSAYERMILQSERTGNESMAILTNKNVIVMPEDYKNDSHEINLSDYGYSINNGNIIDANRNKYNTIATVHTYPDGSFPVVKKTDLI
ncbi:MAG: RHS repeat-associated core domain-containing protein [Coprobacter fastidiosus]